MSRNFTRALAAAAGVALAAPALAQMPGEGPIDLTLCWSGPMHAIAPAPKQMFGNYVVTGSTRNTVPQAMDAMRVECIGTFESRQGKHRHKGYCVFKDASGDTTYGVDALSPDTGYTWQFLGGTGKFAGIAGGGTLERVSSAGKAAPGTIEGCRRVVGKYRLQPAQ